MADALQTLMSQAALALAPLRSIKTDEQAGSLFRKLGYEIPAGAIGSELSALANSSGELIDAVRLLSSAGDDSATASAIVAMLTRLDATVTCINLLRDLIASTSSSVI